ncbi:hypothetical protein MKW92_052022 [Papaver armeniacum]|nr:hypothetical protein MKW92_052022 [Papaver armeniacum]
MAHRVKLVYHSLPSRKFFFFFSENKSLKTKPAPYTKTPPLSSSSKQSEREYQTDYGNIGSSNTTQWCLQRNPLSYLVSIDGFNILIDCGWNDAFDTSLLKPLSSVASTVDAVLLSHSDTLHLGALPYAKQHLGLTAQVYSTDPVHRLGLLTMYDHYYSQKQVSDFDLFSLDDIDFAFQSIETLKYSQNHHLTGKGEGIVIAPHVAGHLLGGTVWKITKDGEDIIYAVDFNHRKESHLNGTVLETFVRPAVLITDAYNALNSQDPRTRIEKGFLGILLFWAQNHLPYPIYFLTYVSSSTIEYAKSFLEWMSDTIAKSFEDTRDNAFLFEVSSSEHIICGDFVLLILHVTLMINKSELEKVPEGPKLEVGSSHDIFAEWATDVKNLVLFTERGQFGTLARMLQADPPPRAVKITMRNRVPLVGEELVAFEEEQNRIKKEEALKASVSKEEDIKASNGSDVKDDDPMVIDASNAPASSEGISMFPFYENSSEWDDFGEIINPDDYVVKEEDMDLMSIHVGGDLDGKLDEVAANLILDSRPSKIVSNEFTGRSDGRSIKSILAHVAPLKLVLVHGSAEATEHLKQHCLKNVCPHVYAPRLEKQLMSPRICVQLSEKLMSKVLFKKLGDHEVAWIDSGVEMTETEMLSLRPISTAPPPHKSVFVGDLKLADFKQFLASKGVQVEFSGGALRCGEYVTLRKGGTGGTQQVIIEGPLSEEYYQIRDYLYSQFYLL